MLNYVKNLLFIMIIFVRYVKYISGTSDNPLLTYEALYKDGVNYYLENNWASCIRYFELALDDYHWWRKSTARCRKHCYDEAETSDQIFTSAFEYDKVFEKAVINTLCLVKCKKKNFGSRSEKYAPSDIDTDFKNRKPYDYLQLCYFKMGHFEDAANAAATFLTVQPDHEIMQQNIKYYVEKGGLKIDSITNLELGDYAIEYIAGDLAYQEENYQETINHLEQSLMLYLDALEECRLLCEDQFDQGWSPEFIASVANHYTFSLRCKRKCPEQLSILYGEQIENFVASIFNYLQISYFKVGNIAKACESVESFLSLVPEDPAQLRNKQFLWATEGVEAKFFVTRKNILTYKDREEKERILMKFIEENFVFVDDEKLETTKIEPSLESIISEELSKDESNLARRNEVKFLKKFSQLQIKVLADEKALNGTQRVYASGFLSSEQCWHITKFTQQASEEGDGYSKGINPHTQSEHFEGVTLSRAAMVVHAGYEKPDILELILSAGNFSKEFLERHFKLEKPLYFSFTHLVCRSSKNGIFNRSLSDLSHSIHVDNCIMQPSGACLKIPPAYTFRDYSALLYLNDDFKGGEFIFSDDPKGEKYQSLIKPHCGNVVAFSAGMENPHGVRPVTFGQRCAMAMWFTFDKKHREMERDLAQTLLDKLLKGDITQGEIP